MIWRIQNTIRLTRGVGKANSHVVSLKDVNPEVIILYHRRQLWALELKLQWEATTSIKSNMTQKCGYFLKRVVFNLFSSPTLPVSQWPLTLCHSEIQGRQEPLKLQCSCSRRVFIPSLQGRWDTNCTSSELKCFLPVQTPWFNWRGHRVIQKHSFT